MPLQKPRPASISALLSVAAFSLAAQAAPLTPLAATGWNEDLVVGVGEDPGAGTTKTMDGDSDTQNKADTWYGVGRNANPGETTTGLPIGPTASQVTPQDLSFTLQSFTADNAIYNGGTLILTTPVPLSRFALIGSTGRGTADITITVTFADSTTEVFGPRLSPLAADNTTVVPETAGVNGDWFNGGPIAYTANGRIKDDDTFNNVNAGNPRLYQSIFKLAKTTSNVISITVTNVGEGNNAIMAISGETAVIP